MSWLLGTDNTSFWSDLTSLPHNALYGTLSDAQKQDVTAAGSAEIQGVVDNLKTHYDGIVPQSQIDAAQQYANDQKRQFAGDVQQLTQGKCGADLDLSGVGLGCQSISSLLKWGAIIAVALVVLYGLTIFAPFIPKRG